MTGVRSALLVTEAWPLLLATTLEQSRDLAPTFTKDVLPILQRSCQK